MSRRYQRLLSAFLVVAASWVFAEHASAIFPGPSPGGYIPALDYNSDGFVDLIDLDILGSNWLRSPATFEQGDSNRDGTVDLLDLDVLGAGFGGVIDCDPNGDGVFDLLDLDIFLSNGIDPSICQDIIVLDNASMGHGGGTLVPEPGTALLLVFGWLASRRRANR